MLLHNHPSGHLSPSGADLAVAARLHDNGVGFGIIYNDATRLTSWSRSRGGARRRSSIPSRWWQSLASMVRSRWRWASSRTGRASATWRPHRRRVQRRRRAHAEAGTGVGKSSRTWCPRWPGPAPMASAPSSAPTRSTCRSSWSARTCRSFATRCATENHEPSFALLKGWRNYLCLARLQQAVGAQRTLLEPDKLDELTAVAAWASRTSDGSLSDLPSAPSPEVWDEVSAESDLCPAAAMRALRPLLCVPRAPTGGAGRRRGGQPPSARRRPRGAAGQRQLAGGRGAAAVPAARARRGAPSRGCRRGASRCPGLESRRAAPAGAVRAERAGD